jgi:hypothetical protein
MLCFHLAKIERNRTPHGSFKTSQKAWIDIAVDYSVGQILGAEGRVQLFGVIVRVDPGHEIHMIGVTLDDRIQFSGVGLADVTRLQATLMLGSCDRNAFDVVEVERAGELSTVGSCFKMQKVVMLCCPVQISQRPQLRSRRRSRLGIG